MLPKLLARNDPRSLTVDRDRQSRHSDEAAARQSVAAFVSFGVRNRSKTRTFVFLAGFRQQPVPDFYLFASKDIRVSDRALERKIQVKSVCTNRAELSSSTA